MSIVFAVFLSFSVAGLLSRTSVTRPYGAAHHHNYLRGLKKSTPVVRVRSPDLVEEKMYSEKHKV